MRGEKGMRRRGRDRYSDLLAFNNNANYGDDQNDEDLFNFVEVSLQDPKSLDTVEELAPMIKRPDPAFPVQTQPHRSDFRQEIEDAHKNAEKLQKARKRARQLSFFRQCLFTPLQLLLNMCRRPMIPESNIMYNDPSLARVVMDNADINNNDSMSEDSDELFRIV